MLRAGLNVHCYRCWLGIAYGRHLVHSQYMGPSWQPGAIAAPLSDVRHRPAIDLEVESEIPSEVRYSIHDEAARRVVIIPEVIGTCLRNSADQHCVYKTTYQKNVPPEGEF